MTRIGISKAEKSYILSSIVGGGWRIDGRGLEDYRSIGLERGVAAMASGSVKVVMGGTVVLGAVKLEVEEDVGEWLVCTVTCSQGNSVEDLQQVLQQSLSHHSLCPSNLIILDGKKSWVLHLDLIVLSDQGNVYDALFIAARVALWDTKVPRTRCVEYKVAASSGFDSMQRTNRTEAMDFELLDNWDDGEVLDGRERWPVAVTLNVTSRVHFLDATLMEEASTPVRVLLVFSFGSGSSTTATVQAMRVMGDGELKMDQITQLIKDGERHARNLLTLINTKL